MSQRNKGKAFETIIEMACRQYDNKGLAVIDKVPTPWVVNRRGNVIVRAFPEKKSTVDFIGCAQGRSIAIEAKTTTNRTSFPLKMVEPHQVKYLRRHRDVGGISGLLIEFAKHREVYWIPIADFLQYVEAAEDGGRKSIPYMDFVEKFDQVKPGKGYVLHFLGHVLN